MFVHTCTGAGAAAAAGAGAAAAAGAADGVVVGSAIHGLLVL